MLALTAIEVCVNLDRPIDDAKTSRQPIVLSGKRSAAVLITHSDCSAVQKILY